MPGRAGETGARVYIPSISSRPSKELSINDIIDSSRALVRAEMEALGRRVEEDGPDKGWLKLPSGHGADQLMGLALSGGGIRSATFSLGVLQALAQAQTRDEKSILEKMDYLSTVSGGGYIGSSLTWYLTGGSDGDTGVTANDFPYGHPNAETEEGLSPPSRRLRYLRQHGNYLIPGEGINLRSAIAIVLRAMLLNLLVWLPVITLIMVVLVWFSAVLARSPCFDCRNYFFAWIPAVPSIEQPQAFLFFALLAFAVVLLIFFVLASIIYSLHTLRRRGDKSFRRYKQRRFFENWVGKILTLIAIFVVVGSIPIAESILNQIGDEILNGNRTNESMLDEATGPIAVLLGLATAIWSFFKAGQKVKGLVPNSVVASVGASLLIYGLLLTAYSVAGLLATDTTASDWAIIVVLIVLAGGTGYYVNVNYIALHRFYRDRLMEAFLPDPMSALDNFTGPARLADPFRLSKAFDFAKPRALYHLINTNLVLVDSPNRRRKIRGGDNFILSPLYCGSNATGWRRTDQFIGDRMTLATAMAISGAAANPNTGVGGVGLTRNRAISLLMALLNLRLGYWATHPEIYEKKPRRPNHFLPGLYEVFGMATKQYGLREDRYFVELSDGGHFENLACYELIRRKLRLIIVCDGGADPQFTFGDLQTMLHRIKEDFGARVTFEEDNPPEVLVPSMEVDFPKDSKRAKQGHAVGTITYADGTRGTLVLLKTTMVPGLSVEIKGYKGAHPDFPDEPTADQFFDEDQFEAYRQLGAHIGEAMIRDDKLKLADLIAAVEQWRIVRRVDL